MKRYVRPERIRHIHKIYEQIHEMPTMTALDISSNIEISRNSVSKYLKEMYAKGIIRGPYICMKPAPNCKKYVYLMNFRDPFHVFNGLKGFPHVVYHALTFGDWNTMMVTDRLSDPSTLVGFEELVYQGERGHSYTPRTPFVTWNEWFKTMDEEVMHRTSLQPESKKRTLAPLLNWGENEWKLFHIFRHNVRRSVTPALKRNKLSYETHASWKKELQEHCSIHVEFYPWGYEKYTRCCFLILSDHEELVKSVFSNCPTTPFFMEVGEHLIVYVSANFPHKIEKILQILLLMKKRGIVREFKSAVVFCYVQHQDEKLR